MKHVNISSIGFIAFFSIAFRLLLFKSSQAFYSLSTFALDKDIYNKELQWSPKNTNLVGTTTKNDDLNKLNFSDLFYLSNDTLFLDKILIVENSSGTNKEGQFFVEIGFINASLVTYNVGNYVEDPTSSGSRSESNSFRNCHDAESGENYAKSAGIFLTENGDIIKKDAFDQIIKKVNETLLQAGIIFFSSADSKNNALSFLINQVELYEFSIDYKNTATTLTDTITTTIEPFGHVHTPISKYVVINLKAKINSVY